MSTSTESIYKNNLLGREEIQCNYLPPNLSPVMEEDSQLWKPQDEIFLKEQQLKLVEEFGEDSGFREDSNINQIPNAEKGALYKCESFSKSLDDVFEKSFYQDGPQMTSSIRSSIESASSEQHEKIRLSLGLGPNHQLNNLRSKQYLVVSDEPGEYFSDKSSFEIKSMRKRSSIGGVEEDGEEGLDDYEFVLVKDLSEKTKMLRKEILVAVNDADAFARVLSTDDKVKDLVLDAGSSGKYYSFCLGRAVFCGDTHHCSQCNSCFDWRYWHCESCNRCSYGLSFGKCEYCSASPKSTSTNTSSTNNSDGTNLLFSNYNDIERVTEKDVGICRSGDSSVANLSDLEESKSRNGCYCGEIGCENLYCNIIQENCLNGPLLKGRKSELFRSRDTSFVLGNRSPTSQTSGNCGKSMSDDYFRNRYFSEPTLELSFICERSEERNNYLHSEIFLSKSI